MRIAIIHPWFPQYREKFFEELVSRGASKGLEIDVYHGDPPPEWASRGDSVSTPFATRLESHFFKFGQRSLVYKSLRGLYRGGPYDLVVVEQGVRNLETYKLLLARHRVPLAFWGHGKTYTKPVGVLQERLKMFLTKKGEWFFGYTPGGVAAVIANGFPSDRTTVVQNTIDVSDLARSISEVTAEESAAFAKRHDLEAHSALFIGGLDSSKRLKFLLAAGARVYRENSSFRLVIAGNGIDREYIESEARRSPWIKYIGPIFDHDKAVAMSACQVLAMPGRVGLVAVDSFAANLPIITTDWQWHAPEFEYLSDGQNSIVAADSIADYSSALRGVLEDDVQLESLRAGCQSSAKTYVLENMVENFLGGLVSYRESVQRI